MEPTEVNLSGKNIPVLIKRHRRARRISLKLSAARDGIILTLPGRASVQAGMAFFQSKADWVLSCVESTELYTLQDGAILTLFGRIYAVKHSGLRGVTRFNDEGTELLVYGDSAFTERRVRDFLKKTLRQHIAARSAELAAQLGKQVRGVTIRNTESRWGSCSAQGFLSFTWQLIFAPPDVLDYIIAHEVAHLQEMNHSDQFWHCVALLCPHFEASRNWLKREGHSLHRYK